MTDPDSMELLPCPFCGGNAYRGETEGHHGSILPAINCSKCNAEICGYKESEAIAAWNTRAQSRPDPGVRALCEWLRRSIPRGPLGAGGGMELVNPDGPEAADALEAQEARLAEARRVAKDAEDWLRTCSGWMLSTDLDMQCPMLIDPLDIADDLAALFATTETQEKGE